MHPSRHMINICHICPFMPFVVLMCAVEASQLGTTSAPDRQPPTFAQYPSACNKHVLDEKFVLDVLQDGWAANWVASSLGG